MPTTAPKKLQTVLEALPVPVLLARDIRCSRIVGNRAACDILRMPYGANLSKAACFAGQSRHFKLVKDGRIVTLDALPLKRAVHGEVVQGEEIEQDFEDGTIVNILISARPLRDRAGRPRGAIASILDITNLKRAENALRQAEHRKDEFLAMLAHELRNPLAPIRTALDLLKGSNGDAELLTLCCETMERQVDQLVRLVDDLLDATRIARDRLELRKKHVDLSAILRQAVETCQSLADGKDQIIDIEWPETPIWLHADPVRLSQVFGNLLTNACKYTPSGGTIRLLVSRDADELVIAVQDNGIGMPAQDIEHVFDMFMQSEDARKESRGGLGIGLTLVKRLVELHGGSVVARSAGPGCGSTFEVRLPVTLELNDASMANTPGPHAPVAAHRILVVDDNQDAAKTLGLLLQREGHAVRLAYDGIQALEVAEQFRPDVVLLNLGLPKLDGLDVCRKIRGTPWGQRISVVALSGRGQADDRQKTKEAGFTEHLVKPVTRDALEKLLQRVAPM